ncbi:MAG: tRNA (N6-isopentenyl adenosine(37)-C2)-methylthiotransferase MiaB [Bacteroidetes bacterium GWE2_29_8]|nr:MAG: tRNA (N6-isopentenyl adenosine(37)-C2)-methylthiotransferase MiaB [Bacteroidetes bacterium GWE2_29_8]
MESNQLFCYKLKFKVLIKSVVYIETYGCQMNFSDSEIVASILTENDYEITKDINCANIIFINTCSIRDNAEQRVKNRLIELRTIKKNRPKTIIGVLGCMAERLKEQLMEDEKIVDLVAGPDSYRTLPNLINIVSDGLKGINTELSIEETYSEITPVRYNSNGVSAFISIMRGCENMCSYCVVPYTRGKERSRNFNSIINEVKILVSKGYKEITLLGQNVNSYKYEDVNFAKLLNIIAKIDETIRIRFATSHPKDLSNELIDTIALHPNICKSIHLPVQSGSNHILKLMNRVYDREWYLERIRKIKSTIPDCTISTDIISGFCGETEQDHLDTLSIMKEVGYEFAYMFKYSERDNTYAFKHLKDDVPEIEKIRRLNEVIKLQQELSLNSNKKDIGKIYKVLADSISKRSATHLSGRTEFNKVVIFEKQFNNIGDYVMVEITECSSATLKGKLVN